MAFDVFISYPHEDKAVADAACARLEAEGLRCWIAPRDIPPSADWAGSIVEAIDGCKLMVLIFSSRANHSKQVYREVQRAFEQEKPVIPFRTEAVIPEKSLAYYMASVHWLDALTPPLEKHLNELASSVTALASAADGSMGATTVPTPHEAGATIFKPPAKSVSSNQSGQAKINALGVRPKYLRLASVAGCVVFVVAIGAFGYRYLLHQRNKSATSTITAPAALPVTLNPSGNGSPVPRNKQRRANLLLRVFKYESELQVLRYSGSELKQAALFPICRWAGDLGPKLVGDRQAPEGFYVFSQEHAIGGDAGTNEPFFRIRYPNSYDELHGRYGFGADIYGDCSSKGAFALTDEEFSKILSFVSDRTLEVPIHIFPFRMTDELFDYFTSSKNDKNRDMVIKESAITPNLISYWRMLQGGYQFVEEIHQIPDIYVLDGNFVFRPPGSASPKNAANLY